MTHFGGVDLDRVKAELQNFVAEAAPKNGSRDGFITTTSYAQCGRPRAIELVERVRPVLDALYADWRTENPIRQSFEFAPERDACMRLIARIESHEEVSEMIGDGAESPQLSAKGMHEKIWGAATTQWSTGHRHEAVLAAAKAVNSLLQQKLNRRDVSESKLVREGFSERPPAAGKPRMRFTKVGDEQARESLRQGAMDFGAGCFAAIRNPVGHLPNDQVELSEQDALERLAALSLLARWIDQASVEVADSE
jgi:uncharacterized protein (TIGR02391 family)